MDYHYEALNDQRFQKLAQALIVAQNPNTQCLPVGQPDGGRDAYLFHTESDQDKLVVFQVKFSRDPSSKTERDAIKALIKSEQGKSQRINPARCDSLFFRNQYSGHGPSRCRFYRQGERGSDGSVRHPGASLVARRYG